MSWRRLVSVLSLTCVVGALCGSAAASATTNPFDALWAAIADLSRRLANIQLTPGPPGPTGPRGPAGMQVLVLQDDFEGVDIDTGLWEGPGTGAGRVFLPRDGIVL